MKKFLLSLAAVVGMFGAVNAAEYSYVFESSPFTSLTGTSTSVDLNKVKWNFEIEKIGTELHFQIDSGTGKKGFQIGAAKKPAKTVKISTDAFSEYQIQSVVVEMSQGGKASFSGSINVGNYTKNVTLSTTNAEYSTEINGSESGNIEISLTNGNTGSTGNGAFYIKSIKVVYEEVKDDRADAGLKYSAESFTGIFGEVEESFLPTLDNPNTLAVTYSSSDESVATVAADGTVSLVGEGTTTITATSAETEEFKAGKASYTLTLKPAGIILESLMGEDFTFENPAELTYPWTLDATYGLKGTAFINKKTNACEGYAVSPVIDLTNYKDATLDFLQALNMYKNGNDMISVSEFSGYAYIVAREEGATEWETIEEIAAPESFSWDYYAYGPVSLTAYAGKKMQFAFKYVSTATVAGTWEIKNILVKGTKKDIPTGVESVEVDANAPKEYYNLQGVRVANPEKGIYIVRQGGKTSKVIL